MSLPDTLKLVQTEFTRHMVVMASAGSGKTTALALRLVAWCLGPGWEICGHDPREVVESVVAVTFSEEAAAQMWERTWQMLKEVAAGTPPPMLAGQMGGRETSLRARSLLDVWADARIGTLHSFCRGLLAKHCLALGLRPGFVIDAEGSRLSELASRIVREVLREATSYGSGSEDADIVPPLRRLLRAGVSLDQLAQAVLYLSPFVTVLGKPMLKLQPLRAEMAKVAADLLDVSEEFCRSRSKYLRALGEYVSWVTASSKLSEGEFLEELRYWWRDRERELLQAEKKLARYGDGGESTDLSESTARLLALSRDALLSVDQAAADVADVVWRLAFRLRLEKLSRGVLSFDDLIVMATELVSSVPDVVSEIRQLLIDEAQDLDEWQARLVAEIADSGGGGGSVLFLVGDELQSIYGWRGARSGALASLKKLVIERGGQELPLPVNRRSVPEIVSFANLAVSSAMKAASPSKPVPPLPAGLSAVECWVFEAAGEGKLSQEALAKAEAEAVASEISKLVEDRATDPSRLAILMRAKTWMRVFVRELEKRGIPVSPSMEADPLRSPELLDAACVARALLDPADLEAIAGLLTSPALGIPTCALSPLWSSGYPKALLSAAGEEALKTAIDIAWSSCRLTFGDTCSDDWRENALRVGKAISLGRELMGQGRVMEAFMAVHRKLRLDACYASSPHHGYGLSADERVSFLYLRLAQALQDGMPPLEVARLARSLPFRFAGGEESAGVRVMTVHAAKGLGFDMVWLVQTKWGRVNRTDPNRLERTGDGQAVGVLAGIRLPGFWTHRLREQAEEKAELVRLLYVALTRAERRLVVTIPEAGTKGGDGTCFVDLLRKAVACGDSLAVRSFPVADLKASKPVAGEVFLLDFEEGWHEAVGAGVRPAMLASASAAVSEPVAASGDEAAHAGAGRAVAALVGEAIHWAFQHASLAGSGDPEVEFRDLVEGFLESEADPYVRDEALKRAAVLMEKLFAGAAVWPRWLSVRKSVVARELDLLVSGEPAVVGRLDMVYRDGDVLVGVDFKTDSGALDAVVSKYLGQCRIYLRALEKFYGGDVRFELWLIAHDKVVAVDVAKDAGGSLGIGIDFGSGEAF